MRKEHVGIGIGIIVTLYGAMKLGELISPISDISLHLGEPRSELEVDFYLDGHGKCHAGSHADGWRPHMQCTSGLSIGTP